MIDSAARSEALDSDKSLHLRERLTAGIKPAARSQFEKAPRAFNAKNPRSHSFTAHCLDRQL